MATRTNYHEWMKYYGNEPKADGTAAQIERRAAQSIARNGEINGIAPYQFYWFGVLANEVADYMEATGPSCWMAHAYSDHVRPDRHCVVGWMQYLRTPTAVAARKNGNLIISFQSDNTKGVVIRDMGYMFNLQPFNDNQERVEPVIAALRVAARIAFMVAAGPGVYDKDVKMKATRSGGRKTLVKGAK